MASSSPSHVSPPTRKIKCVTVGVSGAGKTSLVNRMFRDAFSAFEEATIGASFLSVRRGETSLDMWDTAGQERYGTLLPMYLRSTDVALVVVSSGSSRPEVEFERWSEIVRSQAPGCHLVRITTKMDCAPDDFDETRWASDFYTSALTGDNCEDVITHILDLPPVTHDDRSPGITLDLARRSLLRKNSSRSCSECVVC